MFQVRNEAADDGLWTVRGKRQVIYARHDLSASDRLKAPVTRSSKVVSEISEVSGFPSRFPLGQLEIRIH